MTQYRYKAFISYSHTDEKWAKWLHRNLETYRVPKHIVEKHGLDSNRLMPIFRDRDELASSGNLSATIQQALVESENLIAICSPDAANSRWVNEEIKQFQNMGKGDRVFCLLVGDPNLSFPAAALVDIDGDGYATLEEVEPLAADARPDADGKQGAKLKLVASLLGIRLDRLRRRDVQRRNRRLLTIATTATVGMVFSMGLALYAIQQQQRAEAEAETAKRVTEFLLSTFEQSNPSLYRSAEPSARDILQQGAMRVRYELLDRPEIRARLMATIGSAFLGLDQWDDAERLLSEALALQQQMLGQSHLDLVPTLQDLAAAMRGGGDVDTAISLNTRALQIQEELLGSSHVDVAAGLLKLARVSSEDDAESLLLRALEIVVATKPESPTHGDVLRLLSDYYMSRGELEKCTIYLLEAAEFQEAKAMNEELIHTLSGLGNCYGHLDRRDESLSMHARAISIAEDVYGVDHPWTAFKVNNLAVQHHHLGNLDLARSLYQRVLSIAEQHMGPHSGVRRVVLGNLGELERDRGAYAEAEGYFEEVGRLQVEATGKTDPYLAGQIALLRLAQQRFAEAQQEFDRYFTMLGGKPSSDPIHAPINEGYEQLLREVVREPDGSDRNY